MLRYFIDVSVYYCLDQNELFYSLLIKMARLSILQEIQLITICPMKPLHFAAQDSFCSIY